LEIDKLASSWHLEGGYHLEIEIYALAWQLDRGSFGNIYIGLVYGPWPASLKADINQK
jgi:hypothetical protein